MPGPGIPVVVVGVDEPALRQALEKVTRRQNSHKAAAGTTGGGGGEGGVGPASESLQAPVGDSLTCRPWPLALRRPRNRWRRRKGAVPPRRRSNRTAPAPFQRGCAGWGEVAGVLQQHDNGLAHRPVCARLEGTHRHGQGGIRGAGSRWLRLRPQVPPRLQGHAHLAPRPSAPAGQERRVQDQGEAQRAGAKEA